MSGAEQYIGRPAAEGIALGSVFLLHPAPLPVVPEPLPPERVDDELRRLDHARAAAHDELAGLREQVRLALGERYAGMLDAQQLILDDPLLLERTRQQIQVGRVSARWALKEVVAELLRRFEAVPDEYLRERGGELADVHRRLQRLLRGEPRAESPLPEGPLVVVTHAIGPSDTVLLARQRVVGLATDAGGVTSHSAILAQALSIPAVVGLRDLSRRVRAGETLLLDGSRGEVIVRPDRAQLEQAERRRDEQQRIEIGTASLLEQPPVTLDGTEIVVRANVEFPAELERACQIGTSGVGLFRSEFLFLQAAPHVPDDSAHAQTYAALANAVAPHPVVVRALDLGGDKTLPSDAERDRHNPALGMRGIRLCLSRPDLFGPQLRGMLLAAAEHETLSLLLPMLTTTDELLQVRAMLAREADALRAAGLSVGERIPLGAMIEVPAAALAADEIAVHADFLSLGTNDLMQYSLAADRGDEALASIFDPSHRGICRLIDAVVRAAAAAGRPLTICGELAADPVSVPLLLGLGLRELSVQPRLAPAVRDAIRRTHLDRATQAAQERLAPVLRSDLAQPLGADD